MEKTRYGHSENEINLLFISEMLSILKNLNHDIKTKIQPFKNNSPFWILLEIEIDAVVSQLELIENYYLKLKKDNEWCEEKEIEIFFAFNEITYNFLKNLLTIIYKKFEIIQEYNLDKNNAWIVDFLIKLRNLLFHPKINSFKIEGLIDSAMEFNYFSNQNIRDLKIEAFQKRKYNTYVFLLDNKNTIMFGTLKTDLKNVIGLSLVNNDIDLKHIFFNSPKFEINNRFPQKNQELISPISHFKMSKSSVNQLTRFSDPNCWVLYIQINNDVMMRIEMYTFMQSILPAISLFI